MIRRESLFDFLTWVAVGTGLIFLVYVYGPSSLEVRDAPRRSAAESNANYYVVQTVLDGDSLAVSRNGETLEVRIAGIDCPEHDQPYGEEAKRFTESVCGHRQVTLDCSGTDQYGRAVCDVFVDGRDLAESIVANGYGWHYKKYSSSERLNRLEAEARHHHLGLWQDRNPVSPWNWRQQRALPSSPEADSP